MTSERDEALLRDLAERVVFLNLDPHLTEAVGLANKHKDPRLLDYLMESLWARLEDLERSKSRLEALASQAPVVTVGAVASEREQGYNGGQQNQEGTWMTLSEIIGAGCGVGIERLRQIVGDSETNGLKTRRREGEQGRPYEVLITPESRPILRLNGSEMGEDDGTISRGALDARTDIGRKDPNPVSPSASDLRPADPVPAPPRGQVYTFSIGARTIEVHEQRSYDSRETLALLSQVHPGFFTDANVVRLFTRANWGTKVSGNDLAEVVRKTEGMMLLDSTSTRTRLSQLGYNSQDAFLRLFRQDTFKWLVHTLPGLDDRPFILEREVHEIYQEAEKKRKELLKGFNDSFTQKGILPKGKLEGRIMNHILNSDSLGGVERTYPAYEKAMEGWVLFDEVYGLIDGLKVDWTTFRSRYFPDLKNRGLVKDLGEEMGTNVQIYVLARGKLNDVYQAVNIKAKPKTTKN